MWIVFDFITLYFASTVNWSSSMLAVIKYPHQRSWSSPLSNNKNTSHYVIIYSCVKHYLYSFLFGLSWAPFCLHQTFIFSSPFCRTIVMCLQTCCYLHFWLDATAFHCLFICRLHNDSWNKCNPIFSYIFGSECITDNNGCLLMSLN